jgi:hypothetical protein
MKRFVFTVAGVFVFATVCLAADRTVPTQPVAGTKPVAVQPEKMPGACCISGKYSGMHTDTVCTSGQNPKKTAFIMDITQDGRCGEPFRAKVIENDKISYFTGTVHAGGPKGCCVIEGNAVSGTEKTHFKGTLCKNGIKWEGKGDYDSTNCNGAWEMHKP